MATGRATAANCLRMACLYILVISLQHCRATDTLTKDSRIYLEQTLVSANQVFELGFFNPGNSTKRYIGIWYKNIPARKVIWVANRENPLSVSDTTSSLTIGNDGNLIIQDGEHNIIWSTNVRVQFNETVAKLTDTGDLALNDTISGSILWESFDYPSNSLLPGMKLGTKGKTQGKNLLTSWKSDDDPTPGEFVLGLSAEQPPQAFIWHRSKQYWRSGPWDGGKFIGIPEQESGYSNVISLMPENPQGGAYLTINRYNSSHIRWLYLEPDGVLQLNYWDDYHNMWDITWGAPDNPCDVYGVCGASAICTNKSPICECLKGFVPQSKDEWSKSNWTTGCVRRSELLCEKNGSSLASGKTKPDKFWMLRGIKLPDHHQYFPYTDTNGCQRLCLGNCSCKAYAYVEGIDCMIWTEDFMDTKQFSSGGENLFLRLAYVGSGAEVLISLTTIGGALLLGGFMFCLYRWTTYKKGRKTKLKLFNPEDEIDSRDTLQLHEKVLIQESIELPIYEFKQIITSTDNFSYRNKLGEGGFGAVYKGTLDHGQQIAVKRLSGDSGQGIEEFKNEIILISKLQHRNLVKLLGCCIEGEERLLIYEYMTNKSLDTFLFNPKKRMQLDWATRFNIILGIGRGIVYLHRDSCLKIIHRDLKASNILLDEKMNPKISDFGMARIFGNEENEAKTKKVVGTYGYMSPEYAMNGHFSTKSDVFSFGVLVLEIVSGQKNSGSSYTSSELSLLGHTWTLWKEGKALKLVDESIRDKFLEDEAIRCIQIGLLCVQEQKEDRPCMSKVLWMLNSEIAQLPQPKYPGFFIGKRQIKAESSSKQDDSVTINEVTITMIDGR
ncbi:G-type lectin S-receptor-like serine/threonine-protein kinase At1g61480 [Cynara cardunculus var. scolymus]|uniref:G-type lectin S-receptor-like serine/threonine-protein kinase At1g61480 n=1 Tax=Cynara cardunculus var. scolymus TaxID=59895 RepID=UPI000D62BBFF|nr:G-type lectin S-receptor-like serine/threonine-protein kinase At1g61480 [Cynara cardunculus var. scolymus]